MRPTLHPHLKRGLAFDDYHVHPDDIIESPEHVDAEEQEAKRRRIEKIVSQCLKGRPPVLLSAALKRTSWSDSSGCTCRTTTRARTFAEDGFL